MSDLGELYQQVILDHNRNPRNFKRLDTANRRAEGNNPLCGDRIQLYVQLDGDTISDIGFQMSQGSDYAISEASASLMTEALQGLSVAEARNLFHDFHALVTQGDTGEDLGKLAVFTGVREYPMRVKCATLAWHTLIAALDQKQDQPVSTE